MLNQSSNPTCGILYIDDEEKALKYFRMAFAPKYPVFTAASGSEGVEILRREADKIGIVISDQRMPGMQGAEVLGIVREEFPQIVRILTTAYSDLDSAIQAVNQGHIYQYVVKPWEIPDLGMVLQRAANYFRVLSERNALMALKMTTLQRLVCTDRLKWLLLSGRTLDPARQAAFRRALIALIQAMPASAAPAPSPAGKYTARDFDAGVLIREEYETACRGLDAMDAARASSGSPRITEAVAAKLQPVAATPAGKPLGELLSRISGVHGLAVESVAAAPGVTVRLLPGTPPFSHPEFVADLFSLLAGPEISVTAVLLLETLTALAGENASLCLAVEGAEPVEFRLPDASASEASDVIEWLRDKFESWNIATLPSPPRASP
ncbi:MAG TPA: response regulator [Terrimicrobiaceae bacterium]|nr:response regulator [Terrimicrobiaceae bacterium]